jgi:hypothetical protein
MPNPPAIANKANLWLRMAAWHTSLGRTPELGGLPTSVVVPAADSTAMDAARAAVQGVQRDREHMPAAHCEADLWSKL